VGQIRRSLDRELDPVCQNASRERERQGRFVFDHCMEMEMEIGMEMEMEIGMEMEM
jgi:hypothetical protein